MLKVPGSASHGFSYFVFTYQERVYWLIRRMVLDHDDTDELDAEQEFKVALMKRIAGREGPPR